MPYIKENRRKLYIHELLELAERMEEDIPKGDLTYILFYIAKKYVDVRGVSYTNLSNAISCLIDAAEELRQRDLREYETQKLLENGDVHV